MKNLGLKKILILSVVLLVGFSVSISNYVLYLQEKNNLTTNIIRDNKEYVKNQSATIEQFINEKVSGINKLAALYKDKEYIESSDNIIQQTKVLAAAFNTGSAAISFNDGISYWNVKDKSYPNHIYNGDIRTKSWYQEGQKASTVTVSEPYLYGTSYWITIIEKIKNGAIATDFELTFLNEMVKKANDIPGTTAVILNSDTTVLASSSPFLELGEKGDSYTWFTSLANTAVSQENSMQYYKLEGNDKIFFSHRIRAGDKQWYFCVGINKSIVFTKLDALSKTAIATVAGAVIISIIITFLVLQILYRPIIELKKTILGLSSGDGNLTKRLDVNTNDDLGQIAQGINQFIDKIKDLLVHEGSQPLTKNEQELNVLNDNFTQKWKDAFEQYKFRIDQEEALREELKLDALTKLPARSYFEILLSDAIKDVYSKKNQLLLVTINLGNYEAATENLTYNQTQNAILELANEIKELLPENIILSRTGQSEFSVIFKNCSAKFNTLIQTLALNLKNIETQSIIFHCKLGASLLSYQDEKPTVSTLLYQVNNALYSITSNKYKNYAFYQKEHDAEKELRQNLILDFKQALERDNNELELYFQPQVDILINRVIGIEALIRWNHPEKGFLAPDKFVHVLDDDIQLNTKFGEWLITSALDILTARTDPLTISINITPSHLQKENFFDHLKQMLQNYPTSVAKRLKIELTETDNISDHSRVDESMRKCSELGVRFSLDDFGTGYSTLSQLRTLPASELKIDRSFVQDIENNIDDRKMVGTMMMLAKNFDISVVVEGVENKEQENLLRELGCSTIQGYYYSKPISYADFNLWLTQYNNKQ